MLAAARFDPAQVRTDFPALAARVHGRPLAYLDNAATTQLPRAVMEAVADVGRGGRANVHRGVHALSERATAAYEAAREAVQRFLNARSPAEIVFVRGATEGINLVARSFASPRLAPGDEIVVTGMEHHSNLLPWHLLCEERGARLVVLPVTDDGELSLEDAEARIGPRARLLCVTHVSNAIGSVNAVRALAGVAHARAIPVLVDGAQAAAHLAIDVQALDADFYVISGHKLYGPSGIGALYARAEHLERMPPFLSGGDMVRSFAFDRVVFADTPHRFEAGTPNLEGAVGLAAAIGYLSALDRGAIAEHERALRDRAVRRLAEIPGLRRIGAARESAPIVSFVLEGVHAHDVGTVLDEQGVAVRTGHHCAEPLVTRFGVPATVRASFALYNTEGEVDALAAAVERAREMF